MSILFVVSTRSHLIRELFNMYGLFVILFLLKLFVFAGATIRCEFSQYLAPEQTYYMYSPGYPRNYTSEVQCRWVVTSPPGYVSRLNCSEIVLAQSPSCSLDRLLVSDSGDPLLMTANSYCGRRSVTEVSISRRITMSLIASKGTPGGRILCEVTAEHEILFYQTNLAKYRLKQWNKHG